MDPQAQPRFAKLQPVPYAMKAKIDKKLERLAEGIITRVLLTGLQRSYLCLKEMERRLGICGNYKLTVNSGMKMDTYPIPKVKDLLTELSESKKFTKLDLSQAFQQIELDNDSKKYATVNTHKGLYIYNRLSFGISSAPGMYR